MGRRLQKAGAQVGKLTVSLMWDNGNDLDIHCETPAGDHIWYGAKKDGKGGELDIDQVRVNTIAHARIKCVGKSQSCMFSNRMPRRIT